jgi:predicted component of type VI protein secretion system
MVLILEVIGRQAAQMGGAARKEFRAGGTVGRLPDNDWIFPSEDRHISGHHARISLTNGTFYIVDTSTNGLFVNSPQNRLSRGQPYALQNGDVLYIDDYEIRVSLNARAAVPARSALIPEDPFNDSLGSAGVAIGTDPLELLGLPKPRAAPPGPRAANLEYMSPMSQHYEPPLVVAASPELPDAGAGQIPDDYDPLASDYASQPSLRAPPPARVPRTGVPAPALSPPVRPRPAAPPALPEGARAAPPVRPERSPAPALNSAPSLSSGASGAYRKPLAAPRPEAVTPAPAARPSVPFPSAPEPTPAGLPARLSPSPANPRPASGNTAGLDFAALLAGAGIDSVGVTPELAQQFGQILRVVVVGLMDVLRARERIKDEFRVPMTSFKQQDNNPLKFSANVEDALHNLLVKRNAAYLRPVEAFEDAFQDVRDHQMAMLAGLRVAYEAMLAEFEPGRLQEEFDRQIKAGPLLGGPGKRKYWELYCNRFRDMVKDADSSFRSLFGDEFAKAYEEQLERLKSLNRANRR